MSPCILALTLLLTPAAVTDSAVVDSYLEVPETIRANGAGFFSGQAVFVVGTGGGYLDYAHIWPILPNAYCETGCFFEDGFCTESSYVAEGDRSVMEFSGHLIDRNRGGAIEVSIALCPTLTSYEMAYTDTIRILEPEVPLRSENFGLIKARFEP